MSTDQLKGVGIGAGYFSQFHYDAWARLPDVQMAALCDLDSAQARAIQERFGVPSLYEDWREMLAVEKPDFVDIITPPATHAAMVAEAGQRGIHVICQKPLAPSWPEAEAMVHQSQQDGIRFMVHENFRFQPWYREIKRQLDAGTLGDRIFSIQVRSRPGDGWGENAYIPRQPYFREYPRFLVYETGVHFIDTFRYLLGEVTRVTAWLRQLNPVIRGEDCGLLVFEFAGGALGQWDANRFNESTAEDPRYTFGECLVEGSGGSLRLYGDGRLTLQPLGESEREISYHHEKRGFGGDCCYATQRHFIDRLRDGQPFETNGEDYLKTLRVQEAVYRSAETRLPVELKE